VVSYINVSKRFYIDIFGAKLFREYRGNSLVMEFLGHWMLLVTSGGPTEDRPNTNFIPPENKEVVSHSYTIRVKDCEQSYKILTDKGVEFITPPITNGTETRCFFRDPDGHLFEISKNSQG
jgi:catechol 2,3-dioxygenase-like lactoylglutathione lyase family enzyme